MPRKPIAFLTMDCLDGFVAYDHLVKPPLNALGWSVVDVPWRSPSIRWEAYDAVIIRTPWDYHHSLFEFLGLIDAIDRSGTPLFNSAAVVRWNIDKQYLKELEQLGIVTVPTAWVRSPSDRDILDAFDRFGTKEIVIKPTIGAGARDTIRIHRDRPRFNDLAIYRDRMTMVQPFVGSILSQGEWSLFYFGGKYSHAVAKIPKPGDFRVQEEYGSFLQAVLPTQNLLSIAEQAIAAVIEPTLYARVDLVMLDGGEPAIIELELIEPSLYFPYDAGSPQRFAEAIDRAMRDDVASHLTRS